MKFVAVKCQRGECDGHFALTAEGREMRISEAEFAKFDGPKTYLESSEMWRLGDDWDGLALNCDRQSTRAEIAASILTEGLQECAARLRTERNAIPCGGWRGN